MQTTVQHVVHRSEATAQAPPIDVRRQKQFVIALP